MSKFQQKAEAQTKQIIGQMLGDELLVEEGKKQQREATEHAAMFGVDGGDDLLVERHRLHLRIYRAGKRQH